LGPASAGLDDEAAETLAGEIAATQALGVPADEAHIDLVDDWWASLRQVLDRRDVAQLVGGT
jgi:hypothetical protein